MPATMATVSAILKEIYEPKIQEQLNDAAVTLKRIERTSEGVGEDVGGRYVTFGVHVRRNSGLGARNELELLPGPGQQGNDVIDDRVELEWLPSITAQFQENAIQPTQLGGRQAAG